MKTITAIIIILFSSITGGYLGDKLVKWMQAKKFLHTTKQQEKLE